MNKLQLTYAAALSQLTVAMIEVHERTCEIPAPHRWENCTSTPSIFAVADGLDVIDAGGPPREVAVAMHDRECQRGICGDRTTHAGGWRDQALALVIHVQREKAPPPRARFPQPLAREGELLRKCQCGHIRRNHSIDARRCYYSACSCMADGGFREAQA